MTITTEQFTPSALPETLVGQQTDLLSRLNEVLNGHPAGPAVGTNRAAINGSDGSAY